MAFALQYISTTVWYQLWRAPGAGCFHEGWCNAAGSVFFSRVADVGVPCARTGIAVIASAGSGMTSVQALYYNALASFVPGVVPHGQ